VNETWSIWQLVATLEAGRISLSSMRKSVSGWGRHPVLETTLMRPESVDALTLCLESRQLKSALPRGLGRSYGDAAVNPSGLTVLMERLNRLLAFDSETGIVHCESGVDIADLIDTFLPRGWFPLVVPGTKYVTVGGAIASDIHGKNHHRDGSFANAVKSFKLLCADGKVVNCSRQTNAELFGATLGGMGLTGFVMEAEILLQKISTASIRCKVIKTENLDDTLELFEQLESEYQYSVAWIDCLAAGKSQGRAIHFLGNHIGSDELSPKQRNELLASPRCSQMSVPFDAPSFLLNKYSIAAFNELFWLSHSGRTQESVIDCNKFFFPLDRLDQWNRLYGKRGFVQYQCVVPLNTGRETLKQILTLANENGKGSFLAVLKRFGAEQGYLSFPKPGFTLALDMPVDDSLAGFLNQLTEAVVASDGRVYLAKDAHLTPEQFRAMYPQYKQWQEIKQAVDPQNVFRSALSDRVGLT
jgi:FAD/FMN-containing dehydrogenase